MGPKSRRKRNTAKRTTTAVKVSSQAKKSKSDDVQAEDVAGTSEESGDTDQARPTAEGDDVGAPPEVKDADQVVGGDRRLRSAFFDVPCEDLARALLGKVLVRKMKDGAVLKGVIVETEAYLGGEDKAAHSYDGKKTNRNAAMYMDPGTIYVYHIYGIYTCINFSSKGEGAAVLIRGVDALDGIAKMKALRGVKRADKGAKLKDKELGNGPSKLTQALSIDKASFDQKDVATCQELWLEEGDNIDPMDIVTCSRVGVDYAEEWAKKPLRFYVKGNKGVSVRDKVAEEDMAVKKNAELTGVRSFVQDRNGQHTSPSKLNADFYDKDALSCATALLGCTLVRVLDDGSVLKGVIVETEAYLGVRDGSCHCFQERRTPKTTAMFAAPGTAYVYKVYYSYHCFNISCQGEGAVVLIRALEPTQAADHMRCFRMGRKKTGSKPIKEQHLCNGPSKLCIAMDIDKERVNQRDLTTWNRFYIERGRSVAAGHIVATTRIGLNKIAEEWRNKPWRFYILGNNCVSFIDKAAEQKMAGANNELH